jgi:hypothetical protein
VRVAELALCAYGVGAALTRSGQRSAPAELAFDHVYVLVAVHANVWSVDGDDRLAFAVFTVLELSTAPWIQGPATRNASDGAALYGGKKMCSTDYVASGYLLPASPARQFRLATTRPDLWLR